jgi:hypothetical protein
MSTFSAIETKYVGPTNARGARIVARAGNDAGRLTVYWDHSQGLEENHKAAARALAAKLGWDGAWRMGWSVNGAVFVRSVRTGDYFRIEGKGN